MLVNNGGGDKAKDDSIKNAYKNMMLSPVIDSSNRNVLHGQRPLDLQS